MNRRRFLQLGVGAGASLLLPVPVRSAATLTRDISTPIMKSFRIDSVRKYLVVDAPTTRVSVLELVRVLGAMHRVCRGIPFPSFDAEYDWDSATTLRLHGWRVYFAAGDTEAARDNFTHCWVSPGYLACTGLDSVAPVVPLRYGAVHWNAPRT